MKTKRFRIKKPYKLSTRAKLRLYYYRILLQISNFVDKFWKSNNNNDDVNEDDGLYRKDDDDANCSRSKHHKSHRRQKSLIKDADCEYEENGSQNIHHYQERSPRIKPTKTVLSDQNMDTELQRKNTRSTFNSHRRHKECYHLQYEHKQKKQSYAEMYLGPSHSKIISSLFEDKKVFKQSSHAKSKTSKSKLSLKTGSASDESVLFRPQIQRQRRKRRSSRTKTRENNSRVQLPPGTPSNCDSNNEQLFEDGGDHHFYDHHHDNLLIEKKHGQLCILQDYEKDDKDNDNDEKCQSRHDRFHHEISRRRVHFQKNRYSSTEDEEQNHNPHHHHATNLRESEEWTRKTVETTKTMEFVRLEKVSRHSIQSVNNNNNEARQIEEEEDNDQLRLKYQEKVEEDRGALLLKERKNKKKAQKMLLFKRRKEQSQKAIGEALSAFKNTFYALTHWKRSPSAFIKYNKTSKNINIGMGVVDTRKNQIDSDIGSGSDYEENETDPPKNKTKLQNVQYENDENQEDENDYIENSLQTRRYYFPYVKTTPAVVNNDQISTDTKLSHFERTANWRVPTPEEHQRQIRMSCLFEDGDKNDIEPKYVYKPNSLHTEKYANLLRK